MRNGDDHGSEAEAFLADHPEVQAVDMLVPDMTGVLRGKEVARAGIGKLFEDGVRLPGSIYLLDVTGDNIPTLPYGRTDGDPDHFCRAVDGTLKPVPWARRPRGQLLASLVDEAGAPHFADPRQVLAAAARPLAEMGLTPVVAIELEFYLLDPEPGPDGALRPAAAEVTGLRPTGTQVYSVEELYDFETLLGEIGDACTAQDIPADTVISEFAPGQFEINLHHRADPVLACDQAVLLKRAIKGVARKHGRLASFMSKPFADQVGSGLHVHVSLQDAAGDNPFAGSVTDAETGLPMAPALRHAIGGLAATMAEGMAIFAPTANAYRRFRPGSFAPVTVQWGTNNRTVALRVPPSDAANMRVEHRVAGADANPYLVLAAVLAGIHHGLSNQLAPPSLTGGDGYAEDGDPLPVRWEAALDRFAAGSVLPGYLGEEYAAAFLAVRRHECDVHHATVPPLDYDWYLRTV